MSSDQPEPASKAASKAVEDAGERKLLLRHLAGDKAAFPELVTIFRTQVYSYLLRLGVEKHARDDLFQDIFMRIHQAARLYDPEMPLRPWVFTVVANTARSYFRKVKIRMVVQEDAEIEERGNDKDVHQLAEAREMIGWLQKELKSLPLPQREVVILCLVQGISQHEVALALNIPLNTVKTHLRRARLSLVEEFEKQKAHSKGVLEGKK